VLLVTAIVQFLAVCCSSHWDPGPSSVLAPECVDGSYCSCSVRWPGVRLEVSSFDFFLFLCESLKGDAGIVIESPDQKTQKFMVQIALPR
jgi:hypothetical protein